MGEAVVERLGQHALGLAGQPGRPASIASSNERLEAAGDLVLVVRVGPLDRVAQQRDQLDLSRCSATRPGTCGWNR